LRRYAFPGLFILALVLALHTFTIAGLPASLPVERVEIVTAGGHSHVFEAAIADTMETRMRGLMFVTRLEPWRGMLFDFGTPGIIEMWMKNTPLSLDMLFIEAGGRIVHIEAQTRPFSTELISSRRKVLAVLEIVGGRSAELGIAPGDRVVHRLFPAALEDQPAD
jgi:uncharacterized protein